MVPRSKAWTTWNNREGILPCESTHVSTMAVLSEARRRFLDTKNPSKLSRELTQARLKHFCPLPAFQFHEKMFAHGETYLKENVEEL